MAVAVAVAARPEHRVRLRVVAEPRVLQELLRRLVRQPGRPQRQQQPRPVPQQQLEQQAPRQPVRQEPRLVADVAGLVRAAAVLRRPPIRGVTA